MKNLRQEIEEAVNVFRQEFTSDLVSELDNYSNEQGVVLLTGLINGNKATWSGGHSVTNLMETIRREVAADLLRNVAQNVQRNAEKK